MKAALVLTALISCGAVAAAQGQPGAPAGFMEARAALTAAAKAVDETAYGKFLTEDLTWVDRAGGVRNKTAVVAGLNAGSAPADNAPDLRSYGDTVVLMGKRQGTRYLQLWVRRGANWQMVAHQGTPDGTEPVSASDSPSPPWPADVGSAAEIAAIKEARAALDLGNAKADPGPFTALTTDRFAALGPTGMLSKADRIRAIKESKPATAAPSPDSHVSIRVHGDAATVVAVNGPRTNVSTIAYVKQGGTWLRAAIIQTPIENK
jgi:hypothetical protein